ncbi:MAG: DUF1648 domain-containing protein [Eudoraea sp.]|nr:DUF1648 domain-containing protein [Eudoraea sp.]
MPLKNLNINQLLNLVAATALLMAFVVLGSYYGSLPKIIPIHFNAQGIADGFGNKSTLWVVPVLAFLMCLGLFQLNRSLPKIKPNIENKEYITLTRVNSILSLLVALSFSYITIRSVYIATTGSGGLGSWFLPVFCISFIVGPIIPLILHRKMS